MMYALHISIMSGLSPTFNKCSKKIKEAREGVREEGKEGLGREGRRGKEKGARKASGLKRKKIILLVNLIIYMENSTVSTKMS